MSFLYMYVWTCMSFALQMDYSVEVQSTKTRLLKIVSRESVFPCQYTQTIDWAKMTYTY